MSSCKSCLHYEVCNDLVFGGGISNSDAKGCKHFKPKSRFVEVKHGEWVEDTLSESEAVICSLCGYYDYTFNYYKNEWGSNYCPRCGAKMDGEKALKERER